MGITIGDLIDLHIGIGAAFEEYGGIVLVAVNHRFEIIANQPRGFRIDRTDARHQCRQTLKKDNIAFDVVKQVHGQGPLLPVNHRGLSRL